MKTESAPGESSAVCVITVFVDSHKNYFAEFVRPTNEGAAITNWTSTFTSAAEAITEAVSRMTEDRGNIIKWVDK